jgi:GGDEF domain-containing protein
LVTTGSHPARRSFGARVRAFWKAPDEFLRDAGKAAELVIARLRLGVTLVLLLFPLVGLAQSEGVEREQDLVTFFIAFAALLVALLVLFLVERDRRQPWLPMTTSLIDVSLISLGLLAHGLLHLPGEVLEARAGFDLYFLALAATCLRYDARIALVAGSVAIAQYLGVAAIAVFALGLDPVVSIHEPVPGTLQVARSLLLAGATGISILIVRGLERQRRLSSSDPLTGLFNRRFFDTHLGQEVGRAQRYQRHFSVAMIDVDLFKQFNDTRGHPTGGRALQMLARVV